MKVLLMDVDKSDAGSGVDLAMRAEKFGHTARYYITPNQKTEQVGVGLVDRIAEWEPSMDWADLIILTGNSHYEEALAPYFGKGYPIFGANAKGAELELDREVGQKVLLDAGVPVLPYQTVSNIDEAIELICKTKLAYAIKPWGGTANKAMTLVARDADEAIFMLNRWKQEGLSGQLMLQEKVEGVEMGIAGWFGPGGWSEALEESFEHKKFMVGDLGCNTGEMGTVLRHVTKSKLFRDVLEPVTDYLHSINYVGDCSVNCIIDDDGTAWPLEFTCRLGWPDFVIRQAVIECDPVIWMADLLYGVDSYKVSTDVVVGVVLAHGDFPTNHDSGGKWEGYPIEGISEENESNLHLWHVMMKQVPKVVGKEVKQRACICTAGNYIMVASGAGETVSEAQKSVYGTIDMLSLPSNLMYRTDIGDRLAGDLARLHENGYAKGMRY